MSFFESFIKLGGAISDGQETAAATTGPAKGPLPASSMPVVNSLSIVDSNMLYY